VTHCVIVFDVHIKILETPPDGRDVVKLYCNKQTQLQVPILFKL